MGYKDTVNLPKTDFPMRASLPQREPGMIKRWDGMKVYKKMLERRRNAPLFVLHDGPPYSNGHIHLGHTLNKVVKDIIVKYKYLSGYRTPFVPGWDNHGMPIENIVIKEFKGDKSKIREIRKRCREFAGEWIDIQREEFRRLGVFGDWDNPYLTMSREYEGREILFFADLVEKGYVYRGYMPIHWCPVCETALALAEIEYKEKESPSIWFTMEGDGITAVVWTTTPWTIISNVALAFHPDYEYVVVKVKDKNYVLARELLEKNANLLGWENFEVKELLKGTEFEGREFRHPFIDRISRGILADFVTLEEGTGIVHIAPGHGKEDFEVGREYDLPVISPVDERGRFTREAPGFEGLTTDEASRKVVEILKEKKSLLREDRIVHQYPHCWRCKHHLIFRATEQWFLSIDHRELRKKALSEIDKVEWIPPESKNRIYASVEERPEWCLSRQRVWGLPIPAFYCKNCKKAVLDPAVIRRVGEIFLEHGSDIWYERDASFFLPPDYTCPHCGGKEFEKENDILDVWFDSGVSSLVVLRDEEWPSHVYLEGPDQHRGWFNSSLMVSCAIREKAPYRVVITHGWVLDEQGRAMHKALGNVISPLEVIGKYGADLVRLWVGSSDYTQDVRLGPQILERLVDAYRKIRNTYRFMLGNLYDFTPEDALPSNELLPVDRYILSVFQVVKEKIKDFYEKYTFHRVYHTYMDFVIKYLSSFYLDILKDRLYTYGKTSKERRSAQTVLHEVLSEMLVIFSPVLSFTTEEAWSYLPGRKTESVFYNDFPPVKKELVDEKLMKEFEHILSVREDVLLLLEKGRREKIIGNSLEAKVMMENKDEVLEKYKDYLPEIFIVSQVEFGPAEGEVILEGEHGKYALKKADGNKCERCWVYSPTVGEDPEYPSLCSKCREVIRRGDYG